MSKGVPLVGSLQRALKRPRPLKECLEPTSRTYKECLDEPSFKVTIIKKGEPDYERLSALGRQLVNNVENALVEIHSELQRISGRVVSSDYSLDQIKNYVEIYSLDPEVLRRKIEQYDEENDEDDNSSYD